MNCWRPSIVAFPVKRAIILTGWTVALLALGSSGIENAGASPLVDHREPTAATDATIVTAAKHDATGSADPVPAAGPAADPDKPVSKIEATATDPSQMFPAETPSSLEPMKDADDPAPAGTEQAVGSIEILDECYDVNVCIDRYLWALYQRAPKQDTTKVYERRKVTVKKKGKLRTVTRTFTRLVNADFTWKDPKAAEKAGMPMTDYVIGGMERSFKLKLFHLLHAAEAAGLSPGITSAFRDDYRQSIASGLKAANDRSYHGGSYRGGYGRGLAADVVSVRGATRAQRWVATSELWKWIDAHGKEFGVGRPYLDRDPPHVGPIDGKEYVAHRSVTKVQVAKASAKKVHVAKSGAKKRTHLAARRNQHGAKPAKTARSSKVRTT